jgi:hypothetical protein
MLRVAMHLRALPVVALVVVASACKEGESFEDQPNAASIDTTTSEWDDGPAPTPDLPLMNYDAGMDAGSDAGQDAGSDAGQDAGSDAGSDASQDAGSDAG